MEQTEILVKSTLDNTMQPSLFYKAESKEKRPLLVGLHTWSFDRFNQVKVMMPYAEKYNLNLLLPEFRGANVKTNPDCTKACGSEYAKQDIKDAIDYVIANENVDEDNVFLLGASGGGHMALLMAGFCPDCFKAIGSFVPISDIEKWSAQNKNYTEHILACCSNSTEEMKKRSPVYYMNEIAKANVKIFHGKYDSSVPVTQSIDFFNSFMEKYPQARMFLDVFDGGHEMNMEAAMFWIMSQYNEKSNNKVTS